MGTYTTNITRRRQSQAANKAGTHVRKDIAVEIRHNHDTVGVRSWVLHNLNGMSDARMIKTSIPEGKLDPADLRHKQCRGNPWRPLDKQTKTCRQTFSYATFRSGYGRRRGTYMMFAL